TPHGGGGPGCGPVAVKKILEAYRPVPIVRKAGASAGPEIARFILDSERPKTVGRLRSFVGNFGMMVRAYAYIREMGKEGLKDATDLAVLNANYVRAKLHDVYDVPYGA